MKKVILLSGLAAGMFFMANCAKKTTGSLATSNQSATSQPVNKSTSEPSSEPEIAKIPVVDMKGMPIDDQIKEGKVIWHNNCGKCHELYSPVSRTRVKWEHVLPVMVKKAKLTDYEAALVNTFIMSTVQE